MRAEALLVFSSCLLGVPLSDAVKRCATWSGLSAAAATSNIKSRRGDENFMMIGISAASNSIVDNYLASPTTRKNHFQNANHYSIPPST
jgi:hypothetical protein